MSDRPNILYIFTDQQFAGAMSCAGNQELHTPAMDSLAETGVLFENAYCSQPLCTPSRGSMFTGRMPHETGIDFNGIPIPDEIRDQSMGNLFEAAGYDCAYAGKWHLPRGSVDDEHGFRELIGFGDIGLAEACIDYLKEPKDRPFLLVASYDNPHNICEWARHQNLPYGNIPRVPTEDCPNLPANFAIPPFEPDAIRFEQAQQPLIYPTVNYSDEEWRHLRHAYFRLIEKVDAEIGKILDTVRDLGLDENTLIIFSSDHGDGHGSHHWNQKSALYEEQIRIPYIVSLKGATKGGHVDRSHLVSNGLDIIPTICDYAGIEAPDGLRGRSVRSIAETGAADEWRNQLVVETYFGESQTKTRGRALRTNRYKYTVYSFGMYREQLTDMENDHGEMVNLAANSKYREVLQEHRDQLQKWCEETGDNFKVPID